MNFKESLEIIDCHSHFFPNAFGPNSDPNVYVREATKIGISGAIISASPTPKYDLLDKEYYPCLWVWNTTLNKFEYFSQTCDINGNIIDKQLAGINPFREVNLKLLHYIKQKKDSLNLFMSYLHHPILDTPDEMEFFLKDPFVKAVKIHGISTASTPDDISKNALDLFKKYKKPVITHIDYSSIVSNPISRLYRENNAIYWIKWSQKNNISLLITHAARRSEEAIKMINSSDKIILGCSPDLMLKNETERLETITEGSVFDFIIPRVNLRKLVCDIDYGWNVIERNQWEQNDWTAPKRMAESLSNFGKKELTNMVLRENSIRFFDLEI